MRVCLRGCSLQLRCIQLKRADSPDTVSGGCCRRHQESEGGGLPHLSEPAHEHPQGALLRCHASPKRMQTALTAGLAGAKPFARRSASYHARYVSHWMSPCKGTQRQRWYCAWPQLLGQIKGLSEAKVEKMLEAARKLTPSMGWQSAMAYGQLVRQPVLSLPAVSSLLPPSAATAAAHNSIGIWTAQRSSRQFLQRLPYISACCAAGRAFSTTLISSCCTAQPACSGLLMGKDLQLRARHACVVLCAAYQGDCEDLDGVHRIERAPGRRDRVQVHHRDVRRVPVCSRAPPARPKDHSGTAVETPDTQWLR